MKIATEACATGVTVLRPMQEHGRYDLAFEIAGKLLRVQCKWGALIRDGSVVQVKLEGSRCTPAGYVRSSYTEGGDRPCLRSTAATSIVATFFRASWPPGVGRSGSELRPTLNGQRACLNFASQFEFRGGCSSAGRARGWQPRRSGVRAPSAPLPLHRRRCAPAATSSGTTSATTSSRRRPAMRSRSAAAAAHTRGWFRRRPGPWLPERRCRYRGGPCLLRMTSDR